jgi:hypothetical protein
MESHGTEHEVCEIKKKSVVRKMALAWRKKLRIWLYKTARRFRALMALERAGARPNAFAPLMRTLRKSKCKKLRSIIFFRFRDKNY